MTTADQLKARRKGIAERAKTYPKKATGEPLDNQLDAIMKGDAARGIAAVSAEEIQRHADGTYPISDPKVLKLAEDFLKFKRAHGSDIEKELYKSMTTNDFITRLLSKRPLMFMGAIDKYILRDGTALSGGFEAIGTPAQKPPLVLADYISYDEMEISALLGVSSPTHFINKGHRENKGVATPDADHETDGIYVGQVGARFERPGRMEWKYMMVTPEQNTSEKGYGKKAKANPQLAHWKEYYGVDHFASYDEAKKNKDRFLTIPQGKGKPPYYLDKDIYKKYLRAKIEAFLAEANQRGKEAGKKAYVHAVGLGTGAWAVDKIEQEKMMIEIYKDVLNNNTFKYIADVDFAWFDKANEEMVKGQIGSVPIQIGIRGVQLHFSQRNPADKLTGANKGKLLVAQYAWDGNSKPGNEYYDGLLAASGDPAAACCSEIHLLHDAEANPENVRGDKLRLASAERHEAVVKQAAEAVKEPAQPAPPVKKEKTIEPKTEAAIGKKVIRKANIYKHPELSPGREPVGPGTNVLGDIHANAITFLFHLVDNKVLSISQADYQKLVDLYFKENPTKADFDQFDQILKNAKVGENPQHFRLMGDDLTDRGTNDYYMLLIYKKLLSEKVPFEVILSNHTIEFLRAYLQHINIDKPTKGQVYASASTYAGGSPLDSADTHGQESSLVGLAKAISGGHVDPAQVKEIVEGYKRNLKLLNYNIDRSKTPPTLTLYTHAPVGIDIVEKLAKKFGLPFSIDNVEDLISIIDKINQHFSQNMDDILKSFDISSRTDPLTFILWNRYRDGDPFKNNGKMTFPDGKVLDVKYVHGHDGGGMVAPAHQEFVVNLDNENGKGDRTPKPTTDLAFYHNPQPLQGVSLKAQPAPAAISPPPLKQPSVAPVKAPVSATVSTKPPAEPAAKIATASSALSLDPFEMATAPLITIDPITAIIMRSLLIRHADEKHSFGFAFPFNNPKGLQKDLEQLFACQGQKKFTIAVDKKNNNYLIKASHDIYNDLKTRADAIKNIFLIGLTIGIKEAHAGLLTTNLDDGKLTLSCSNANELKQIIDTFNQLAVAKPPIFVLSKDGKSATFNMEAAAATYLQRMNIKKLDDSTGRQINGQIMRDLAEAVIQVKANLKQAEKVAVPAIEPVAAPSSGSKPAVAKQEEKADSKVQAPTPGSDGKKAPPVTMQRPKTWLDEHYDDAKLSKKWEIKPVTKDGKSEPVRSVTRNNKEKFQIHVGSMTTQDIDKNTFVKMLRCYKATHGDKLPRITTDSDKAREVWKAALQEVYPKKANDERKDCIIMKDSKAAAKQDEQSPTTPTRSV